MKTQNRSLVLLFMILFFSLPGLAQDTLHLVYHHTQIKPHDSTEAKIDKWVKKLNGQHVDIQVVAYFHKPEFRKFSQERCDELFLVLNRKARALITIESIGPKKGKEFQRTTVDIIYKKSISPAEAAAIAAEEKAKDEEAKAEEKKKKQEEKAGKEAEKKNKEPETKKSKSEVAAEQTEKPGAKKEKDTKDGKEKNKSESKGKEGKMADDVDKDVAFSNVVTFNEGFDMSLEELKYIKRSKFIVAQTGQQNMDDNFLKMVKEYWKLNPDIVSMPYEEAKKMCKEKKKDTIAIFSIAQVKTWFVVKSFGYEYRVLKLGRALCIENTKGKTLYKHFMPMDKERGLTPENLAFGVSTMNYIFGFMMVNKINKSSNLLFLIDENAKELRNKTLVIAESMKHPKLPPEEIPTYYSGKIMWVSDDEVKNVILNRKDVAYVMPVKLPNSIGNYFYYIVDGATGKIYLWDEGPVFQMTMNTGFNKNMDPSQSGYVDKANLKRFEEIINSDPKLDAKREERAAKEKEKVEKVEKKNKEEAEKKAKADAEKKEKAEQKQKEKEAKEKK